MGLCLICIVSSTGEPSDPPSVTRSGRDPQRTALAGYLAERAAEGGNSSIPLSNVLRPLMTPATRLRAKQLATAALSPYTRRRARAYEASFPLRLHLGSGGNNLDGWVNIDLVGARADLAWDLRHRLPLRRAVAEAVFLEHVLEHMTVTDGVRMLHLLLDVLVPGGILRVGVPDAGLYATSYVHHDSVLEQLRPGRPTRMLALGEAIPRSTATSPHGTARPCAWRWWRPGTAVQR